jgi:hypothetical protein
MFIFFISKQNNRLGTTGVHWKELSVNMRDELEKSLVDTIGNMTTKDLTYFMKGSAEMLFEWDKRDSIREMIFQLFNRICGDAIETSKGTGRGFASAIYNMGELGLTWKQLKNSNCDETVFKGIERYSGRFSSKTVSILILG